MLFRIRHLIFDEKDVFIVLYFVFLMVAHIAHIPLMPFRFDALVTTGIFLVTTRLIAAQINMSLYSFILIVGLLASLFLSPYSLAIFYAIGIFLFIRKAL